MTEPAEIARLLDRYGASLRAVAAAWCNTPDDCVQEAFVRLATVDVPPEHPPAWLATVVRNEARSRARAQARRRAHERNAGEQQTGRWHPEPSQSLDPDDCLAALDCLEPTEREIVVMRIWTGLTFEQLADVVGSSRSDVHRRYHAALSCMKAIVEQSCLTNQSTKSRPPSSQILNGS